MPLELPGKKPTPNFLPSWSKAALQQDLQWAIAALRSNDLPDSVFKPPAKMIQKQVETLFEFLLSTRNWVLCFCKNHLYMLRLYEYLVSTWLLSTGEFYSMVDIEALLSALSYQSSEDAEFYESTQLLVLLGGTKTPRIEKMGPSISSILQKRRFRRLPTITHVLTNSLPKSKEECRVHCKALSSLYGPYGESLFSGGNSRFVTVSSWEERNG